MKYFFIEINYKNGFMNTSQPGLNICNNTTQSSQKKKKKSSTRFKNMFQTTVH